MLSPLLSLVSPCLGVRDFVALPLLAPPAFPHFVPPLYKDVLLNESKVARKFKEPVMMNAKGEIVYGESEAVGCKVNMGIHRPDMCIVLDEVGCNTTQEKDGAKGGQLHLCGVNSQPYQSSATKKCHFTCLGLTRLDGAGLMCVVIIQGKK